MDRAITRTPVIQQIQPTIFPKDIKLLKLFFNNFCCCFVQSGPKSQNSPSNVFGATSLYPTVVIVIVAHQKEAGMLLNSSGFTSFSAKYAKLKRMYNVFFLLQKCG